MHLQDVCTSLVLVDVLGMAARNTLHSTPEAMTF